MRSAFVFAAAMLVAVAASSAYADSLSWNNFNVYRDPGHDPLDYAGELFLDSHSMSSERNTQVVESTWSVDDVDLAQIAPEVDPSDVRITRMEWIGVRDPQYTYSQADFILLDSQRNPVTETLNLDYVATPLVDQPLAGLEMYRGELTLDADLSVPGSHFYVGARLAGDGIYQGRNFIALHSIDDLSDPDTSPMGLTGGYFRGAIFGAPYWREASRVWYGRLDDDPSFHQSFEFAFKLYLEVVPEPASLLLLIGGSLVLVRRDR